MTTSVRGFEPLREGLTTRCRACLVHDQNLRWKLSRLTARIKDAPSLCPERLALSPNCGFSTSVVGNRISVADEKRKLKTILRDGPAVWQSNIVIRSKTRSGMEQNCGDLDLGIENKSKILQSPNLDSQSQKGTQSCNRVFTETHRER